MMAELCADKAKSVLILYKIAEAKLRTMQCLRKG